MRQRNISSVINSKLKTHSQQSETTNSFAEVGDLKLCLLGSAELQLIQATLRVDAGRDAAILSCLQHPLDWAALQRLAARHGVLPLVCKILRETAPHLIPPTAMLEMTAFQQAHEIRVLRMTADLIKVVRALEAEGIPVLCLKGPVLAAIAYGDPAARTFADLDVLVRQQDYQQAAMVLQSLGMTRRIYGNHPDIDFTNSRHATFRFPHGLTLEVHWQVTNRHYPLALDVDSLFARKSTVLINRQPLSTLCDEDTALYTCLHGTHHGWTILRFLTDFGAILTLLPVPEWDTLLQVARGQQLYRPMLLGMHLCHKLLGLELPDEIVRSAQDDLLVRWTARLASSYLGRTTGQGADIFDGLLFKLLLSEKARFFEFRSLLQSMLTPTTMDFNWIHLPRGLCWLYPVIRPFRRIKKGVVVIRARLR